MATTKNVKSYDIDKKLVYDAYKAVKDNAGAAGVDKQTIEQFALDLKGNLYKIWNRMSSGSYFPPAVRAVTIPMPIPAKPPVCNGIMPPRDSWMMPPTKTE